MIGLVMLRRWYLESVGIKKAMFTRRCADLPFGHCDFGWGERSVSPWAGNIGNALFEAASYISQRSLFLAVPKYCGPKREGASLIIG